MKAIPAIKQFFGEGKHGREVTLAELKELTKDERAELGRLACDEIGVELDQG